MYVIYVCCDDLSDPRASWPWPQENTMEPSASFSPVLGEPFLSAEKGQGTTRNAKPLKMSKDFKVDFLNEFLQMNIKIYQMNSFKSNDPRKSKVLKARELKPLDRSILHVLHMPKKHHHAFEVGITDRME